MSAAGDGRDAVVELRQYTLRPGRRDDLIEIFEREFVDLHDEAGASVIGHFRDLDDPNRFVWLRGFQSMEARKLALEAIYSSDAWYANRDAVNETLVDYENVLLLRPAAPGFGFSGSQRSSQPSVITATIWSMAAPIADETVSEFIANVVPALAAAGATVSAVLVSERSANNYPQLAIRENENVLIYLTRLPAPTSYDEHLAVLERLGPWQGFVDGLTAGFAAAPQTLRLSPGARSRLG